MTSKVKKKTQPQTESLEIALSTMKGRHEPQHYWNELDGILFNSFSVGGKLYTVEQYTKEHENELEGILTKEIVKLKNPNPDSDKYLSIILETKDKISEYEDQSIDVVEYYGFPGKSDLGNNHHSPDNLPKVYPGTD